MYNTVEHASSIELDIEDADPQGLFTESLLALSDVLSDASGGTAVTHEVALEGPDLDGLLVAWINELIRLAENDGFIPERVFRERLAGTSFSARVAGERGIEQSRIRELSCRSIQVKELEDGAWSARVIIDTA